MGLSQGRYEIYQPAHWLVEVYVDRAPSAANAAQEALGILQSPWELDAGSHRHS